MSQNKVLKQRITDLEDLVEKLQRHCERLEKLLEQGNQTSVVKIVGEPIRTPVDTWPFRPVPVRCADGCDYPSPWLATVPPACRRCGHPAMNMGPYVVTSSSQVTIGKVGVNDEPN